MNTNKLGFGLGVVAFLLFGLWAIVEITTARFNGIGKFYQIVCGMTVLSSFLMPRFGLYALLIGILYVDLLKRLMVFADRLVFTDLYYILGLPAGIAVAFTSSVFLRKFLEPGRFPPKLIFSIILPVLIICAGALPYLGQPATLVKKVGSNPVFSILILSLPLLLRDPRDVSKFISWVVIAMIPVGFYGIFQFFNGYSDFEVEYLYSGLTNVGFEGSLTDRDRPFSTLASPGEFSSAMALGALMAVYMWMSSRHQIGEGRGKGKIFWLLISAFLILACLSSMKRIPYSIIPTGLIGIIAFRSAKKTLFIYGAGVTAFFLLLVFPSEFRNFVLNPLFSEVENVVGADGEFDRLTTTGTFNVRIENYQALLEPKTWSPFGLTDLEILEMGTTPHTLPLRLAVNYGYLPLAFGLLFGAIFMFNVHRALIRNRDPLAKESGILGFSFIAGITVASILGSNTAGNISTGALFWFGVALTLRASVLQPDALREEVIEDEDLNEKGREGVLRLNSPSAPF
jgi:hypothetical protein